MARHITAAGNVAASQLQGLWFERELKVTVCPELSMNSILFVHCSPCTMETVTKQPYRNIEILLLFLKIPNEQQSQGKTS